jgi:hypothetical protein
METFAAQARYGKVKMDILPFWQATLRSGLCGYLCPWLVGGCRLPVTSHPDFPIFFVYVMVYHGLSI